MACFSSQKSSFQYLYDAPLQGRITTLNDYFTTHVCGFCATSLGVRSGSRPAHQATGQGFPAGTSGATQNHAQVGSSSGFIVINETVVYISKWGRWGILGWRHSPKMADAQMCVPDSIGFGETTLVPPRFEYSAWQICVRERKHSTSTCGISTSGTWLPGEESATDAGPWMEWITVPGIAHLNPTEPERMLCPVRQLKLYIRGGRQRMFVHWNRSIRDIMRSHISRWIVETVKETYTQADRQYDRVTAHEVRALSVSWVYNCQVALPDILSAAFWRSSGVFQNSYLRDMACIAEGMSTLGPVVVAQHVVDPGHLHPPPQPTRSVCSHCYDILNEEYLIISWYLHVQNGVAVARNPPTCPAEKRSLGENLVNDGRMWCSAQVRMRGLNFFVWNFAWDRLVSRLYGATATPFRTWRYQLIIRYYLWLRIHAGIKVITWLAWLLLWWFLQCMKNHA